MTPGSGPDIMTLSKAQLQALHQTAYAKRYPGQVLGTCGTYHQPTGSTPNQWGLHKHDTREWRELYAAGYKPADARREIKRRSKEAA